MVEKITDQNLERYDSRLKEWCDRKFFEKGSYGKYQITEESGAVAFYPVPNTPLEGKVKFSFKETMPVSGNKGPENPSTITGVSQVKATRCGKNLIVVNFNSASRNGLTYTRNIDGSVTVSGTATENTYFNFNGMTVLSKNLKLEGTYTLSGVPNNPENNYRLVCFKDKLPSSGENGSGISFSLLSKTEIWFSFFVKEGFPGSGNTVTFYPQLEFGTTATLFEPYEGINYTINLGNTYYGGEIDLTTGVMTVTQYGLILTGAENWGSTSSNTQYAMPLPVRGNTFSWNTTQMTATQKCSHYLFANSATMLDRFHCGITTLYIVTSLSLEDFKTFLSQQNINGTPVVVVYPLETPITVQLSSTEIISLSQVNKYTPRLNTVYTDADSVQISYLKSPIRDEYEKTQAILSLGGNS